jgi:hypothetical protein
MCPRHVDCSRRDITSEGLAMSSRKRQPDSGKTRAAIDGEAAPRLPHERDESSDSGRSAPREIIRRAQGDIEAGRVDTDRGPPADAAYQKQKEAPVRHNQRP